VHREFPCVQVRRSRREQILLQLADGAVGAIESVERILEIERQGALALEAAPQRARGQRHDQEAAGLDPDVPSPDPR
jgi:hypothetical protein